MPRWVNASVGGQEGLVWFGMCKVYFLRSFSALRPARPRSHRVSPRKGSDKLVFFLPPPPEPFRHVKRPGIYMFLSSPAPVASSPSSAEAVMGW